MPWHPLSLFAYALPSTINHQALKPPFKLIKLLPTKVSDCSHILLKPGIALPASKDSRYLVHLIPDQNLPSLM